MVAVFFHGRRIFSRGGGRIVRQSRIFQAQFQSSPSTSEAQTVAHLYHEEPIEERAIEDVAASLLDRLRDCFAVHNGRWEENDGEYEQKPKEIHSECDFEYAFFSESKPNHRMLKFGDWDSKMRGLRLRWTGCKSGRAVRIDHRSWRLFLEYCTSTLVPWYRVKADYVSYCSGIFYLLNPALDSSVFRRSYFKSELVDSRLLDDARPNIELARCAKIGSLHSLPLCALYVKHKSFQYPESISLNRSSTMK